jgi:hypothetical protein
MGDSPGKLRRIREFLPHGHRAACVYEDIDRDVLLSLKDFDEEPIQSSVEIPINVAKVIPRVVFTILCKF